MVSDDITQTGAFVDAGPALKAMIDCGFLAVYVPKPGELDKSAESLARSIEERVLKELIK